MEKYEKPVMEVIEIRNQVITGSCGGGDHCPGEYPGEPYVIP